MAPIDVPTVNEKSDDTIKIPGKIHHVGMMYRQRFTAECIPPVCSRIVVKTVLNKNI
jgi:hypothetical protein